MVLRPVMVLLVGALCGPEVAADSVRGLEFVVTDRDGHRHISSHPARCIGPDGAFRMWDPTCAPLTADPVLQARAARQADGLASGRAAHAEVERTQACDAMAVAHRRAAARFDRIKRDSLSGTVGDVLAAPARLAAEQEKVFALERELDACYGQPERAERQATRQALRERRDEVLRREANRVHDRAELRTTVRDATKAAVEDSVGDAVRDALRRRDSGFLY